MAGLLVRDRRPVDAAREDRRLVRVPVVVDLAGLVLPHQVRNTVEVAALFKSRHEQGHGLVGVVATHHHVDHRIADELHRVVGRGDAAKNDRRFRVHMLEKPRNFEAALAVDHPVQVDAIQADVE